MMKAEGNLDPFMPNERRKEGTEKRRKEEGGREKGRREGRRERKKERKEEKK